MVEKGKVSSVDITKRIARVVFKRLDNIVTADIPYGPHVSINVNDTVAVLFFSENMKDGLIVSAF